MKYPFSPNTSFALIATAIFILFLLPVLLRHGMFVDGVTYAAISRNLAYGAGSIWKPHYTDTLYPIFNEHPPFVLILQSLFFRFFGDGFLTERIYSLITAMANGLGLICCWRLFSEYKMKPAAWLPIILWIATPLVFWSFQNNILENTLSAFCIFSVYFVSLSMLRNAWIYLILAALLIVFAFFSKGFVALFPIAVPLCYYFAFRNVSLYSAIAKSIVLALLVLTISALLLLIFPGLGENFSAYLDRQLIPALRGHREAIAGSRFSILLKLLVELSLTIVLVLVYTILQKVKKSALKTPLKKESVYFFLIGLCASLPLIISLKQRKFYAMPSIAYFVIAASFVIAPYLVEKIDCMGDRAKLWLSRAAAGMLIFALGISIQSFGKFNRDEAMLSDIDAISALVPGGSTFGSSQELCQNWSLVAYLSRVGNLSLACDLNHEFLLFPVAENAIQLPEDYNEVDLGLKKYRLWRKSVRE